MKIQVASLYFISELIIAEALFLGAAQKRSYFPLRLIACVAICVCAGMFYPIGHVRDKTLNALLSFVRFFSLFLLTVICVFFCFKGKFTSILALCTAGYAAQHCTQRLSIVLDTFIPLFDTVTPIALHLGLKALLYFPVPYFLLYWVFARRIKENKYIDESDKKLNIISICIVVLCMVVTRISDIYPTQPFYRNQKLAESVYAVICAIMILTIQFYCFYSTQKAKELEVSRALLEKENDEFHQWKANIDFVNIKCHDLKQHISSLRSGFDEKALKEIEETVMLYNNGVKTGNVVADIVLYEKGTYCEKNGIDFSYIVDGASLAGIEEMDLFCLFGNILNNAIEGVERLEDEDKKAINFSVKRTGNSVIIHEDNYCVDSLKWDGDIPISEKEDKVSHGYGVKSIKLIVDKLGGTMCFQAEKNIFSLNISIPFIEKQ